MANQKISALTTNPSVTGAEEIPMAKSGSNFKMTLNAIASWLGLSGYLTTDGSTNGATGQAQELVNGVTSTTNGTNYYKQTKEYVEVLNTAEDGRVLITTQTAPKVEVSNADGTAFSKIEKDKVTTGKITEATAAAGVIIEGAGVKTDQGTLASAGTWKLGERQSASTTLDTANYIEIEINGTVWKLALVTT